MTATGQAGGQLTYAFDLQQDGPSGVSPTRLQEINQGISDVLHHADDIHEIMDMVTEINNRLPEDIQINTSSIIYSVSKPVSLPGLIVPSESP